MLSALDPWFSNLRQFQGIHSGESCYIFGDGPSLKWFDLRCFAHFPAICCGMLPFHKQFDCLDVRYCLMIEPWLFAPSFLHSHSRNLRGSAQIVKAYRSVIKANPAKRFIVHLTNRLSLLAQNVHYVFRHLPRDKSGKSDELAGFNVFTGSFHASLGLAHYLGFSKIYLVGFDAWTIQPARNLHWYELGQGVFFEATNFAIDFLNILKKRSEIFAISFDGDSRNVQNIPYESHTGQRPEFRENFQLMERRYLDILATFPQYKIYPVSQAESA